MYASASARGEATVKDGDYFGLPSIEAARLCAQAPSDGILISAALKMLAGRCDGIEFSSAGELELKGFPDPLQAFSVSWAPLKEETGARAAGHYRRCFARCRSSPMSAAWRSALRSRKR